MAETKRSKTMNIPFVLDGAARIVKAVSKYTTCADVIAKLPNLQVPLAIYLSVDGVHKQLPGKTRLLKVWRANASSKNVEFVIRKSNTKKEKAKRGTRMVFMNKRRCDKPPSQSHVNGRLSRESLKKVSDLAFFARYQKKRLHIFDKPTMEEVKAPEHSERNKLMRRMTAQSSTSSMDAFLARANLDEMAGFLTFCGHVTTEALQKGTSLSNKIPTAEVTQPTKRTKSDIHEGLASMKLSLKRKFGTTNKLTARSSSTGTIESTDTGYHSVGSEMDDRTSHNKQVDMTPTKLYKSLTRLLEDTDDGPRHSTPVGAYRHQKHCPDNWECTLTQKYLENFDAVQGKNIIMEKFMTDQTLPTNNQFVNLSAFQHGRLERQSIPVFQDQKERCRNLWNQFCDSDSGSEASDCTFDNAFVDSSFTEDFRRRTLRRESAFTDLQKCTVSTRFSLPANIINAQRHTNVTDFDYSFNCSFPRMDNEYHSMDFSCSFDESERSDVIVRMLDDKEPVSDDSLDSFMRTRSFLEDVEEDITACGENPLELNIVGSYESLESLRI